MRLLQNPTSDRVPDPGAGVPASSFPAAEAGPVAQAVATARAAMAAAREARGSYAAPSCEAQDGAAQLGRQQEAVLSALPSQPNERLVYSCQPAD